MKPEAVAIKENRSGCLNRLRNMTFNHKRALCAIAVLAATWFLVNRLQSHGVRTFHVQVQLDNERKTQAIQRPRFQEMHDKWIVITTIAQPTEDVRKLAQIEGWKVVVVGDAKTPANWSYPGCVFLDADQQRTLGYSLTARLPPNSYTRKNLGYLYAIQHGARYIYDTDDDNRPTGPSLGFRLDPEMTGLLYDEPGVMNPYAHFGQPSVWPRGYPLEAVGRPNSDSYRLTSVRPAVQQGLVNGDPDLDAIFRLTRKDPSRPLAIAFDARAPPVALAPGTFAPFNSQNTLFAHEALWALLLPASVAFRVTDIWRGFWAQRLLWLLGRHLVFAPPNAAQLRNAHDYLDDFVQEEQFYERSGELVRFLANWTCPRPGTPKATFFGCVRDLSAAMARERFWGMDDARLVDAWLEDLRAVGYQEPQMSPGEEPEVIRNETGTPAEVAARRRREEPFHRVYFSAASSATPHPTESRAGPAFDLRLFCGDTVNLSSANDTNVLLGLSSPRHVFPDHLLVVVFNHPHLSVVRFLDALYRPHFPQMVYCGQGGSRRELRSALGPGRPLSFINITSYGGYMGYECAVRAVRMNYDVRGYLVVGDDVLLNFWNFRQLLRQPEVARLAVDSYRTIDRHQDPAKQGWQWWGSQWGQVALERVLRELEDLARNGSEAWAREFLRNRYASGLNMSTMSLGLADVYYVPRRVAPLFARVMSVFLKHEVFLEIAVSTTIASLHPMLEHLKGRLAGKSIWGGQRAKPFEHFDPAADYLHPVKLAELTKNPAAKRDYCSNYVHQVLKNW